VFALSCEPGVFFIPQKDAVIRGTGSSMCMTVGLYEHRSFHRSGWSDDSRYARRFRPPSWLAFAASACQSRSSALQRTIDALFSCQGAWSSAHCMSQSSLGPHIVSPLRTSDNHHRVTGRRGTVPNSVR
jgi:hypothetical protein